MHRQRLYQMQSKFLEKSRRSKSSNGQTHRSHHYSSTLCILFQGRSAQTGSPRPYVVFPKIPITYREIADSQAQTQASIDCLKLQRGMRWKCGYTPCRFETDTHWINLPSHWSRYSSVSVVMSLRSGQTGELRFVFLWEK